MTRPDGFWTLETLQEAKELATTIIRIWIRRRTRHWYKPSHSWSFIANGNYRNRCNSNQSQNISTVHSRPHSPWKQRGESYVYERIRRIKRKRMCRTTSSISYCDIYRIAIQDPLSPRTISYMNRRKICIGAKHHLRLGYRDWRVITTGMSLWFVLNLSKGKY